MLRILTFAVVLLATLSTAQGAGLLHPRGSQVLPGFYVSTTGSDSNPGTESQPFLTLTHAQTVMQKGPLKRTYCIGTFVLTSPLALTSADNGETWVNCVISGGTDLTGAGWALHDAPHNIWQLTGITWSFRELYVNGVHATRAKGPVLSTLVPFCGSVGGWTLTSTVLNAPDNSMVGLGNPTSIEAVALGTFGMNRALVQSIASGSPGAVITMQQPGWSNWYNWSQHFGTTCATIATIPNYFENAYEFLTSSSCGLNSGCWYLDTVAHILYYVPRSGENMATVPVVAPRYSQLVTGSGVSNVTFSHSTFEFGNDLTELAATNTYQGIQSGYGCVDTGPADGCPNFASNITLQPLANAVLFTNCSNNITFDHNLFTHIGGVPVGADHCSHNFTFTANKFADNGGGTIRWGDITDYAQSNPALQTSGLVFRNNLLNAGFEYDAATLFATYSRGSIVDHNEIAGSAASFNYSAYQFGWGWPEIFGGVTSYRGGDSVTNNYVHLYCALLPDCGGIYSNGNSTSFSVTGNYVKGYGNASTIAGTALYADNSTQNGTYGGNVVDAPNPVYFWSTTTNGSRGIVVTGNYTTQPGYYDQCSCNTISGNTTFTTGSPPPGAVTIINNAGIQPGVTPGP